MKTKYLLEEVFKEMESLTPEELRADLDNHKDGPLAIAFREAGQFQQEMKERSKFMAMVNNETK